VAINTAVVELAESASDRLLLSVIDTPGFDFRPGRELQLERQVSGIMKYVNDLYAETMGEEAKVIRENKGDQHIHLWVSPYRHPNDIV
jgi:septin family protein